MSEEVTASDYLLVARDSSVEKLYKVCEHDKTQRSHKPRSATCIKANLNWLD